MNLFKGLGKGGDGMNAETLKKPIEVLLVEDNWSDALLMKRTFNRFDHPVNLHILSDGEQALAFLNREGKHILAPVPDLMILDLNLPRMDGRALVRRVKGKERFQHLKIIVMTASRIDSDVRELSAMRISGYLVKPRDLYGFRQMMRDIQAFLLHHRQLPMPHTD